MNSATTLLAIKLAADNGRPWDEMGSYERLDYIYAATRLRTTYTVAVGRSWYPSSGNPAPDYTCGHAHKSLAAAERCGTKLYAAGYVRGSWQACAQWHDWYVLDRSSGERVQGGAS